MPLPNFINMNLKVGSKNQTKIQAVREAAGLYPDIFPDPQVEGVEVGVDLYGHPKNVKETVEGAIERAKKAYQNCKYSFGLEGGLIEVPYTKSRYMEIGACAIFDGKSFSIGLSPAYEWPSEATRMILEDGVDASQALKLIGYTNHEKLGALPGGGIGSLTEGRMTREDFTRYSIIMAMIQLEKPEYYK